MGKSNSIKSQPTKSATKKSTNAKHEKTGGKDGLSPKEEAIVLAMGKLHVAGIVQPKRDMVQALSKNGKTPEAFKKNMGNIKKKGYLEYPDKATVALTDKGVVYVGKPDTESLTNDIYHTEVIKELISKKAGMIFDAISSGKTYDKKAVAEQLGYDLNKLSGYEKDLSKMSTLGFLEKTKTTIRLTEKCFPLGRPKDE